MRFIGISRETPEGYGVPSQVEYWYDRSCRSWIVQVKDVLGNQIGDAVFVYSKKEAQEEAASFKRILGLEEEK